MSSSYGLIVGAWRSDFDVITNGRHIGDPQDRVLCHLLLIPRDNSSSQHDFAVANLATHLTVLEPSCRPEACKSQSADLLIELNDPRTMRCDTMIICTFVAHHIWPLRSI